MDNNSQKYFTENIRPSSSGSDGNAKVGAKRKRMTGTPHRKNHRHEDIPWTAARCNRLLRTITSRIQILRRLSENNFADKATAKKSPARRKIIFNPEGNNTDSISADPVENVRASLAALPALESPTKDSNDPDWFPDDGRKPAQKTYAGRGNKARKVKIEEPSKSARSASIADFRSPFIKRILRTDSANSPTNPITDTPRRLTTQRQIVLDPKTHAERALRTLLDSFDKVLSITAGAPPSRKSGARSLRDMCCRKVPDYIEFEQKYAYDEEEYDFDATETVYVDLERLGKEGWNGLREVVRAHAVKMIADAMDERSWPVESLDRLLDVCERNQATPEGQQILRSWFIKAEGRGLNRISRLMAWSKILDCTGFFFRVLRDTLVCERASVTELLECPSVWQDLLKAMARRSTRTDAAEFLEVYTLACIRSDDYTSNGTESVRLHELLKRYEILQNVMIITTALCWSLDDPSVSSTSTHTLTSHIQQMAVAVCQLCNSSEKGDLEIRVLPRSAEPLLISCIISHALNANVSSDNTKSRTVEPISQQLISRQNSTWRLPSKQMLRTNRTDSICATAKCLAHVSQPSADGFIKDVSTSLLSSAEHTSEQVQGFLKQLAVDTTVAWADYRADKDSYVFADEIEHAALYTSPERLPTRASPPKPQSFRWEAAIGEWVATTPLASTSIEVSQVKRHSVLLDGREGEMSRIELGMPSRALPAGTPQARTVTADISRVRQDGAFDRFERAIEQAHARCERPVFTSGSSEGSPSSSTGHSNKGSVRNTAIKREHVFAETSPPLTAVVKADMMETSAQSAESPLQAKVSRRMPDAPTHSEDTEQDELSATPYKAQASSDRTSGVDTTKDELAPETPAPHSKDSATQTSLAFRPKASIAQPTESSASAEHDELAMTPAPHVSNDLTITESQSQSVESRPQPSKPEERDELAATPAKPFAHSSRVLRSASRRQRSAPCVQEERHMGPRDELATTPAQRILQSPRKMKATKSKAPQDIQVLDEGGRDELGATPQVPRTRRGRPKKMPTATSRSKVENMDPTTKNRQQTLNTSATNRKKQPLGDRSANIRTPAKEGKRRGSDDELGF